MVVAAGKSTDTFGCDGTPREPLFDYDVFLSYSSQDVVRVREVAERLHEGGIRVWFDEWRVEYGDNIYLAVEQGLESSRSLLLFLSCAALNSDWVALERSSALFRDPTNRQRRFVPVLLDDCELPPALARNRHVDGRIPNGSLASLLLEQFLSDVTSQRRRGSMPVPRSVEPPKPHYRTQRTQMLSEELQDLLQRRDALRAAGEQTTKIGGGIVRIRRALRSGAPEEGWELSDGRYLLLEQLGQGGFATVWKAQDRRARAVPQVLVSCSACSAEYAIPELRVRGRMVRMACRRCHGEIHVDGSGDLDTTMLPSPIADQFVAIKVMHAHLTGDPVRVERFFRGARIQAELRHPAIVRVMESKCADQGYLFFVMELMRGGTFRSAVRAGRIEPEQAVKMVRTIAVALAGAHSRRYVHRDVKPSNILLTVKQEPRLSDFDLVGANDTTGGTRTGAIGTLAYSAPECLSRPQDAGAAADVYSLGMTLVFALTGDDPSPFTDFTHRHMPCSPSLQAVLRKATNPTQWHRYRDAGELVAAIDHACTEESLPFSQRESGSAVREILPPTSDPSAGPTIAAPQGLPTEPQVRTSADGAAMVSVAENETEWHSLYEAFVSAKRQCGEDVENFTYQRFEVTLKKSEATILQRHGASHVRFSVCVKGGKAALKAAPQRLLNKPDIRTATIGATTAFVTAKAAEWRQLYQSFIAAKQQCGEDVENFTYQKFEITLEENEAAIVQRYGPARVRFLVCVKDGKAALLNCRY